MIKRILITAVFVASSLGAALPANALTTAEAMAAEIALREAIKLGDYAKIFLLVKPNAEDGDAPSQYLLGRLYMQGKGVKQDYTRAAYWFQQSAAQGYAPAQKYLSAICSRKPKFCQ